MSSFEVLRTPSFFSFGIETIWGHSKSTFARRGGEGVTLKANKSEQWEGGGGVAKTNVRCRIFSFVKNIFLPLLECQKNTFYSKKNQFV